MAIRGVNISGSQGLFIGQPNGSYVSASNGDLTVTGQIVAKEFYTEFVSASVVYSSGSNIVVVLNIVVLVVLISIRLRRIVLLV